MTDATRSPPETAPNDPSVKTVYRHRLTTRVWHWINVVTVFVMIGSGATILNAHPHLYWGEFGANPDTPWLNTPHIPSWFTIPAGYNLALARRWHLTFALVLAFGLLFYWVASLLNGHAVRDLRVRLRELRPAHLWFDAREHLALRFHDPEHPNARNIFQKLAYILVVVGLIPAMILSGLAMSPTMSAAWPWVLEIFSGRASARSVHFIAATGLVVFIVVHLVLVILAGAYGEVKSMVTGWWSVPASNDAPTAAAEQQA